MIPINFNARSQIEYQDTINLLCSILLQAGTGTRKSTEINKINFWCHKYLNNINGKSYSFKDVITATFDDLLKIKDFLNNHIEIKDSFENEVGSYIANSLYRVYFPRKEFVDALDSVVCPYCNRNYINSTIKRTTCQLDHFFTKSIYPLLAVSFYNLIPVCTTCNHIKGISTINYSPHDSKYTTNRIIGFNYHVLDCNYLYDKSKIRIDIYCSDVIKQNIIQLQLEELYQTHTDLVQELIIKRHIYNDDYIKRLYSEYGDLFGSMNDFYRVVFGNYLKESDFKKRPLSKLSYDICKELGIIIDND